MANDDIVDAAAEHEWLSEQRTTVASYLLRQRLQHGEIGEWPAWIC